MSTETLEGGDAVAVPKAQETSGRLTLGIKFSWASGAFGVAILTNSVSGLILYYLTTVVGISGWIAGLLLMISKLYDAFSDPVAGWLSDRMQSPQGRRRPFLLWGALLSAVTLVLVFTVPFRGDTMWVWAYVLTVHIFYTTGYSTFNVPYMAMAPEMTDNYHERSVLQGWRVMFASAGGAVAGLGSGLILAWLGEKGADGRTINDAFDYGVLGVLYGFLVLVSMLIAWHGTRNAQFTVKSKTVLPWKLQASSFLSNVPALLILGVKGIQLVGIASAGAATFFLVIGVLGRSPAQMPLIGLPSMIVAILLTPYLARLSKKIGKRWGYMIGAVATAIGSLSWIFATPDEPIYFLVLRGIIMGVAFSANVMFGMSMLNDAMELDAHRTGMRREGLYAAFYSFVEKFGYALGPAAVGAALSMAGFDKTARVTAENYDAVRQAALLGVSYIPTACAIIAVILLSMYGLNEKELAKARATSKLQE